MSSLVVIGVGGMGLAVARRLGTGRPVVVADRSSAQVERAADELREAGLDVATHVLDVTDAEAVADFASQLDVATVVHTAGLSPAQAGSDEIFRVDMLGPAHVIEAFEPLVGAGSSLVVIASMAGQLAGLDRSDERLLAVTPTADLMSLDVVSRVTDSATAYMVAKRAVQLRVAVAASAYGARGARVNSVSPGMVDTSMAAEELASPYGEMMRAMIDAAPVSRLGLAEEVAGAVAYLSSADAAYVTGTDLLVDGGVVSTTWS